MRTGILSVVAAALVAACGASPAPTRVDVLAAASLRDAFAALADRFEADTEMEVILNVAASSTLATQIEQGAEADVFASADLDQVRRVVESDDGWGEPQPFAHTPLTLVVPVGNPAQVASLADLARPDLVVVLAAEEVPLGRYTRRLLAAASVAVPAASFELDAQAVLHKVALGEADAGIVYRANVRAGAAAVDEISLGEVPAVVASYWIVARPQPPAQAFVDVVLSVEGAAVLEKAGFER